MSHLFLTGFMGAGKSTVGRIVAEKLDRPFIDLDAEIERQEGVSIEALFEARGEAAFRDAEHAALESLVGAQPSVVATGGGLVLREDNQGLLRAHGVVVYLAVTPEEAMARLGGAAGRPLLSGGGLAAARDILSARLSVYSATADHVVDTDGLTPQQVAETVLEAIGATGSVRVVRVGGEQGYCAYEIILGDGLVGRLGERVAPVCHSRSVALVTDVNVDALYGSAAAASLENAGLCVSRHVLPAGEESKSWTVAGGLLEEFAARGVDRSSAVVALGGGVVGDVAGFCAASYMRGVDLVHVPTTLLAQVDSSIGGKTGVDLAAGKNLAGAFWPPALVITDSAVLQSLPASEWTNGLVETVKAALLAGEASLARVERDLERLMDREGEAVRATVADAVMFKARIVTEDLREAGLRECLNLGHTLGHALELLSGYGSLSHGLAVAEGMRFACSLATKVVNPDPGLAARVGTILDGIGAGREPVLHALVPHLKAITPQSVLAAMKGDKKARGGVVRFVLLRAPGTWRVEEIDESLLLEELTAWASDLAEGGVR
ncbi:MAG: 3-dehydroquinate synthase [Actinobacteria bacterium]|nr:3-dehydroquinate synthase [Actinomycetota bacterium]